VFLSQPDGTMRFVPLPRRAQLAPWQGVVAGDFNGDGLADIVAAQNSRAPVPSIGRFEGGLGVVLRGDGEGGFEVLAPSRSGWVVPGDARAVVRLHLDGDGAQDLVVSRSDASLLAFRALPEEGGRFLTLELRGPAGNADAAGARITVTDAEGRQVLHAVHLGGSGAGQSGSSVVIGYRETRPPRSLRIAWPGGRVTEQPFPRSESRLSLSEP
jgi:enediyne biosynthesis protein E4